MTIDRIDSRTGEVLPAVQPPPVSPLMLRPALSVADVKSRVDFIREIQREVMDVDVHYGVIPGTGKKPTLLKPGAELLCVTFQLDPEYDVLPISIQTETFINYIVRCSLRHVPSGQVIATGLGGCNSREEKYAYRTAARVCPECRKAAIIKGKAEYGGGWLCFGKKGGCGAKFPEGAPEIERQASGKVPNENLWDLANTLLKMACKRAHIAATLNGTAASDTFTQDLEDLASEGEPTPAGRRPPAPEDAERGLEEYEAAHRATAQPPAAPSHPETMAGALGKGDITTAQISAIQTIARKAGVDAHEAAGKILMRPVATLTALSKADGSAVIKGLQAMLDAEAGGGR